jgi:hypothetical protein
MTRQEWDQLWWEEFLALRRENPNKDLLLLHKATTAYMDKRYGARPPAVQEAGPPWWMKLGATAIGVPMGFLQKFWDYMNGKKTVVGVIITVLATAVGYAPAVLAFVGVGAATIAQYIGIATTVLGVLHKIYKWLYHEDHA